MIDIRQNKNYTEYLKSQNWIVEEKDGVFYYIKKILFFSVMKVQRPAKIDLVHITKLAKEYRAIQIVIEPNTFREADKLIEQGWKITSPFIPSKTVILQLNKPEKTIYDNFSKDHRYSLRKSENVKINSEDDLEKFREYWKTSVDMKRHVLSLKEMEALRNTFKKNCLFLTAEGGTSGGIFLVAGDVGYYWYGFVGDRGRKQLSQYKLVWEGIKWTKAHGAKQFDMEGIFDERFPLPAWQGFTKFKKGFGGETIKHPGAYQKTIFTFHN